MILPASRKSAGRVVHVLCCMLLLFAAARKPASAMGAIRFNEVFPDPTGSDAGQEFVELVNGTDETQRLLGWRLVGAKGKSYAFAAKELSARALQVFQLAETKVPLANAGMTLTLFAPDGTVADTLTYGAAKTGRAYAKGDDGNWAWTASPTPGAPNAVAADEKTSEHQPAKKDLPPTARIADLGTDDSDAQTFTLVVLLPPNVLGTKTFVAQDRGGGKSAVIRAYGSAALPALVAGDVIEVLGKHKGDSRGLPLISTVGSKVTKLRREEVTYIEHDAADDIEAMVGGAVHLHGILVQQTKRALTFSDTDGTKEILVILPAGSKINKLTMSSEAEAKGVMLSGADGPQLLLENVDDFTEGKPLASPKASPAEEPASIVRGGIRGSAQLPRSGKPVLLGAIAILALVVGWAGIAAIRRKKAEADDLMS